MSLKIINCICFSVSSLPIKLFVFDPETVHNASVTSCPKTLLAAESFGMMLKIASGL